MARGLDLAYGVSDMTCFGLRVLICVVSRAIVDLHEGVIGVESEGVPGEGCMFFVEIGIPQVAPSIGAPSVITTANGGASHNGASIGDTSINESLARSEDTARSIDDDLTADGRVTDMNLQRVMIVDDSAFNRKMMKKRFRKRFRNVMFWKLFKSAQRFPGWDR